MTNIDDNKPIQEGLEAARDIFNRVGQAWSGCDAKIDVPTNFRYAACAFNDLANRFEELGGSPLDVGGYRQLGDNFQKAAELIGITIDEQEEKGLDRFIVVEPLQRLALAMRQRAKSADMVEWEHAEEFQNALHPLTHVAAELTFMSELISSVAPELSLSKYRPYLEASMANSGLLLIETARLLPVTVAFISLCPDLCTPCGTTTGAYTFSGRFQVAVVQGGNRRVDPIFTISACCSESCLLILSRCNTMTIEKVVPAPNRIALTGRGGVARAKGQIRALIRGRRLAAPAFVAADCP